DQAPPRDAGDRAVVLRGERPAPQRSGDQDDAEDRQQRAYDGREQAGPGGAVPQLGKALRVDDDGGAERRGRGTADQVADPWTCRGRSRRVGALCHDVSPAFRMISPLALSSWPMKVENRSEEHTSELQSRENLVCRLLLEKKNK